MKSVSGSLHSPHSPSCSLASWGSVIRVNLAVRFKWQQIWRCRHRRNGRDQNKITLASVTTVHIGQSKLKLRLVNNVMWVLQYGEFFENLTNSSHIFVSVQDINIVPNRKSSLLICEIFHLHWISLLKIFANLTRGDNCEKCVYISQYQISQLFFTPWH